MITRYAGYAALIMGIALLGHAALAFSKNRWVTGLLEIVAAMVLLWQAWLSWRASSSPRERMATATRRPD
jgi:threonine/homoserine/homoserine lactone efflux protein